MLDLFSADKTTDQRLESLKEEIKDYQKRHGTDSKRTKVKLFFGDVNDFGKGVLIITSPPKAKFFETAEDKFIIDILTSFDIRKFYITYNYLAYGGEQAPKDIKEFGYYIRKLIDIINPKLIVCMGEDSQFCFFKRKFMMINFHGKQIGDYESIPIMTTYPIYYYEERSKFEDHSYKENIRNADWTSIKNKYEELQ